MPSYSAAVVVLAGGTSRRFGGGDKTGAALGAGTVLGSLLAGLAEQLPGVPVTVVGPEAGGGPAAALAAGCAAFGDEPEVVVALAGDLPFAATAAPRLLRALARLGPGDADGVVGTDPGGRQQPLVAAYRAAPLRLALGPDPAGRALRHVLAGLRLVELPLNAAETLDVDTPADLARARALVAAQDTDQPRRVRRC